ncbi:Ni/Fe hydrogenase subunit alpha [Methanocella sp. CWC-04]|uniref:Ni/Fe hydrogenase subunit alpha n=1 Tax=Methanooceanicella nereidis TaxID=2052831 RepID=A0AAP2RG30_9EURY|nr:Ni/Fe hydrogenase subunit alpha [Methanocella sp. CWC-04]MCD1295940.1 Ni/Fe hydrogenase subunit alpha [Methanocella sp. CWC-04]
MKKLTISPITRIEGHASVTVNLDDKGEVSGAHFHATELRGFEKFLEGAAVEEAPRITPRICGICPTAHHLASAKAVDEIYGAQITATAHKLRELLLAGQLISSHSLHLFYLGMPDFILGPDSNPALRNVAGLVKANRDLAKMAIEARKIGQRITEDVGGKAIHPVSAVPGGMSFTISPEKKNELEGFAKRSVEIAKASWDFVLPKFEEYSDLVNNVGIVQSDFIGLTKDGKFDPYDGNIRAVGADGAQLCEFPGKDYASYIVERAEPYSYMKFTSLKKGSGFYRVGPLARINVVDSMGTPEADRMLGEFRAKFGRIAQQPFLYHLARVIEYMAISEKALSILADSSVCEKNIRNATGAVKNTKAVGVVEAPRGTLIHDYTVNDQGFITKANLIVATGHNNDAIDKGVLQAARKLIHGEDVSEGVLNRIEMVVRAYDPCVSCATHAIGRMPIMLRVVDNEGNVIREVKRC